MGLGRQGGPLQPHAAPPGRPAAMQGHGTTGGWAGRPWSCTPTHPAPCTLGPTIPCTLHPVPYTLHPSCTWCTGMAPCHAMPSRHLRLWAPQTFDSLTPLTPSYSPLTLDPRPRTLDTPNPKTLVDLRPWTPCALDLVHALCCTAALPWTLTPLHRALCCTGARGEPGG